MFWTQTQFQIIGPVLWLHDLSFSIGKQLIYRRWIAACMCYLLHSKLLRLFFYFVPNTHSMANYNASSRRLCWRMKVRVESAPSQDEHKASPLPCYGFASRYVHGG